MPSASRARENGLVGTAHLRLHGDLADFTRAATGVMVAPESAEVLARFTGRPALKDVIESAGVPHPEVDLVLVDGLSTALDAPLHDGARVEVFPRDLGPAAHPRLLPPLQERPRFVLDGHLGRLASLLRLLGFDTRWERDPTDRALAETSAGEDRVLLTRDLGLLKRSLVRRGAFVRSTQHLAQAREITDRFHLRAAARPFTRCLACNGTLREASPAEGAARAPPRVRERHDRFFCCDGCGRLYWAGTHHERMRGVIAGVLAEPREG